MGEETSMRAAPRVVVSASLAYDYIMSFPGSFKDHILPDKAHVLSVSFLVDSLRRQRGGVGGNIAYNLALLGEPAAVVGAAGPDFAEYRAIFHELGIDTHLVPEVGDQLTAYAFMMTDLAGNQIAAFYPGALDHASDVDTVDVASRAVLGLVGATAPNAMRRHAAEIASTGCKLVYDPSQQVVALPAEDIKAGVDAAWAVVGNDYELAMIAQKTGLTVEAIADRVPLVAVTFGESGSELRQGGEVVKIPAVPPDSLADPTGGGDAYRAGMLKGILLGLELPVVGRIAALTATYAIERHGTQEHVFAPEAFVARFEGAFPDYAGAISVGQFVTGNEVPTATIH